MDQVGRKKYSDPENRSRNGKLGCSITGEQRIGVGGQGEKFHFSLRLFSRSHVPCTRARENKTRVGRFAYPVMNLNRSMNIYTAIRLFSSPVLCKKIVQWPNRKPTRPCLASAQEENRSRFRIIFISDPNEMRRRRM